MPLIITTVKTARMPLRGTNPTLGEMAEMVEQAVALGVPDSATVEVLRTTGGGVTNAAVEVTWTSAVAEKLAVPA